MSEILDSQSIILEIKTDTSDLKRGSAESVKLIGNITEAAKGAATGAGTLQQANKFIDEFTSKLKNIDPGTLQKLKEQFKGVATDVNKMNEIIKRLPDDKLKQFEQKLEGVTDEFEQLGIAAKFLHGALRSLNLSPEEIKEFEAAIATASATADEFGNVIEKNNQQLPTLRKQIRDNTNELARMESAGEGNTEAYRKLRFETSKLVDQQKDLQGSIRALASDTKKIDAAIQAVGLVASGLAIAQGASALFGDENENLQKSILKVTAAMSILNGVQQLANTLQKESSLIVQGNLIITRLMTAAQTQLTTVFGLSAVAARGFAAALVTTGIGALVVAIGFLISKLLTMKSAAQEAKEAEELLNAKLEKQRDTVDKLNKSTERLIENRNGGINDLERQLNILKAQGKSEQEIFRKELQIADLRVTNARQQEVQARGFAGTQKELIDDYVQKTKDAENARSVLILTNDAKIREEIRKRDEENAKKPQIGSLAFLRNELSEIEALIQNTDVKDSFLVSLAVQARDLQKEIEKTEDALNKVIEQVAGESSGVTDLFNNILKNQVHFIDQTFSLSNDATKNINKLKTDSFKEDAKTLEDFEEKNKARTLKLNKQKKDELIKAEQAVVEATKEFVNQIFQDRQDKINKEVSLQEERVNKFKELAEKGSAEQLQIEEARLEGLVVKQKAYAKEQQEIAATIAAAESVKSIAEGISAVIAGFAQNPITGVLNALSIAATIAATVLSIKRAFTQVPAFKEGTEFLHGPGDGRSDSIMIRASRGERIVDARSNLEIMRAGGIKNMEIPDAVRLYNAHKNGISLSATESKLDRLIEVSGNKNISIFVDENGFAVMYGRAMRKRDKLKSII